MISRGGMQAVKAVAALADLPPGEYLGAGALARRTGAPANYLGKLLRILAAHRLLKSRRGFGGGFRLAVAPAAVTLFSIVRHLEPVARWSRCILGRGACREGKACALHRRWRGVRDAYLDFLKRTTVADLRRNPRLIARPR